MKTAIVTGANGGIGFHTALQLAKDGVHVVLGCRDAARGNDALKKIVDQHSKASVQLANLDLSNLSSVRSFAAKFKEDNSSLDLLVNNAAVMALPERTLSADGYEMQFATNHLGHFLLTAELMPHLLKSSSARIVTVSSIAHRYGKINLNDLQAEKNYEGWSAYGTSKLANLLFSFELARKLKNAGNSQISVAAHPGVAKTNILSSGPQMGRKVFRTYLSEFFSKYLAQTDAEGALPIIHACLDPGVHNGDYYGPNGFMELTGRPKKVESKANALDEKMAEKLWTISESLTGAKWPWELFQGTC